MTDTKQSWDCNNRGIYWQSGSLSTKDKTILSPAAEYRKCHSPLAREIFVEFPGSRKTRIIYFVVLPTLGGKRPSAVGESSPAIIRPQTTPAVMTKSKQSETTVRRRSRSAGEELPDCPPAKQQRYPDSGSEDGPDGGDSSGGQFSDGCPHLCCPEDCSHMGTDAMDTLMASQFRGLFELPIVRCQNSTKLIGCLLSRQLVTARRHEFWFTFGPHPLRFSLDEFRDVAGLNCRAFDVQDSEASESVPPTMWNKLFDTAVGKITVLSVLCMLGNKYLAVEKRLPLALIALVDGVLCPSSKDLKLTPRYVEMLSDVESFLAYPCGRESFLTTVPCFLPPLVVAPRSNPLQVMRDRLSQKTTVCYGFPLALQLFLFDVVPLLLEKIPDAGNTATFIDFPGACSSPSTILIVNEIVVVEEDPDLSVHFTVIPDEERMMLLDQNEDRQVTSLVQKLLCGETFKPEDFPDGAQEEGACPTPVHQRNLRPRNAVPIEVQEILLETAEKGIVNAQRGGSKRNARKRKVIDDPQVRRTPSPDDSIEVRRNNPPSSERDSGHQNDDDHAKENESDNARFPPSGGNKGDQQQETQSNALVLFGDVLDVEPESYVLPAEHVVTSPGAWQKRNPTYRYEQGSLVAWEKTKPNCYSSVGSVRSFHPSWDGNPSSKSKERSAPKGGEGLQKWGGAPPVGYESGQTSNQNDGERLEQVSAPMRFVEALVKEINSEIPGTGEEIRAPRGGEGAQPKENESVAARMTPPAGIDFAQKTGADNGGELVEEDPDGGEEARTADKQPQSLDSVETSNMEFPKPVEAVGKVAPPKAGVEASVKEINAELQGTEDEERYDSCKDDMSTDSQIQENRRDLCAETDADSEDVGSGGKRHRMRSNKIYGVYTPAPRVKKLFKSEEKVEYKPIAKTNRAQFKKFAEILRKNPVQMWDIATGHSVCNRFFLEIAEPGKWMSDEHIHVIMNMLWRRRGIYLLKERMVILDQYFIKTIQSIWSAFSADNDKLQFEWGKNIAQSSNLLLEPAEGIYHNKRGGDCRPCAANFIEMHDAGLTEEMSRITDKEVDRFRE
ncbi:hypothetical protein IGI04_040415 [Brassica rapa subsp. trilocularis]|uniref:DUF1985 domain-containing protein n=1 Tax=Brassica rapa subsp. trilocularis TaxID=1813537 RepID=A0ABQ7KMT5_BRACM|nr:hypothetical protein IGI04_040415 [Brassica rapa subsp. trilocularis]